jgi:hypothetical protein
MVRSQSFKTPVYVRSEAPVLVPNSILMTRYFLSVCAFQIILHSANAISVSAAVILVVSGFGGPPSDSLHPLFPWVLEQ